VRDAQIFCESAGVRVTLEQESNNLDGHILFHMEHI